MYSTFQALLHTRVHTLLVKLQEDSYLQKFVSALTHSTKKILTQLRCVVVVVNAKKVHFDRHFQTSLIFVLS